MTNKEYQEICDYLRTLTLGSKWENHIYTVGGAVRDSVMGNPIKDIDIVLDFPNGGIEFSQWLYENNYLIRKPITYPTYGTSMFVLTEFPSCEIEAVHTRKEQYKDKDSRNPEQEYGSIEDDAFRRDLTINALYYNITERKVCDPTNSGINDINEQIIRVTNPNPDIVFTEDPLRILRAIRFFTRYDGFSICDKTLTSMKNNVDRLNIISKERIADELNKMLLSDKPSKAIRMVCEIGAMKYVIPEVDTLKSIKQNKYHFGNVFEHTMAVLDNLSSCNNLVVRMAGLLHDIGKINTFSEDENGNVHFYKHELESEQLCSIILKRLRYSNDFIDEVAFLCKNHMKTKNWGDDKSKIKDKTLRKLQYECKTLDRFMRLLALIDADNKSHAAEYCLHDNVNNILEKVKEMTENGMTMFNYKLPLNGNDVMAIKGIKPGREVKEVLDYVLKLCFNNPLLTKEECIKHVRGYKIIQSKT